MSRAQPGAWIWLWWGCRTCKGAGLGCRAPAKALPKAAARRGQARGTGLAEGAAAFADSSDGKGLGKAEVELKLLRGQVKPRGLFGFLPSVSPLSMPLAVVPPKAMAGCEVWRLSG